MKSPMRTHFDRTLRDVQDNLLRMADLVDLAIGRSMEALARLDPRLAGQVVAEDAQVNSLRFHIEEHCLAVIATQQPAAGDLRQVVAAIILASELERMADHAAGIAKTVLRMDSQPALGPLADLPRMAETCRAMLREAMDAFVQRDSVRARALAARDDDLDQLYTRIFREVVACIVDNPATTSLALYLLFSAHNLERIGDRVVNIAERTLFMTSGELTELNAGPEEETV
jgi:phosphate transport system protein